MKEKKKVLRWIKEHKKQLIAAGISIGLIVAIIIGIRNRATLMAAWESLKVAISKPAAVGTKAAIKGPNAIKAVCPKVPKVDAILDITPQVMEECSSAVRNVSSPSIPFDVQTHLRNLHPGWHASPEKIAEAAAHGFDLQPGQTWVEAYTKCAGVA